jgi:hypothetical protein
MASNFTAGGLQPHKHARELTDQRATPAPGAYECRSMFGAQNNSTKRTAPARCFGSGTRDATQRQYISPKHSKTMPSNYSKESYYGELDGTTSIGRQRDSRIKTEPSIKFGQNARFKGNVSTVTKDVDYADWDYSSMNRQIESKNQTQASVKFGTGTRDATQRQYISPKHSKTVPSNYSQVSYYGEPRSALGRQVSSTQVTAQNRGWGTEMRGHRDKRYYGN